MAILIDLSQIVISNVAVYQYQEKAKSKLGDVDSQLVRTMILNSLRLYNKQFKNTYGPMIICCDTKDSWRKEYFPNYKVRRAKEKKDSPIEWSEVYSTMDEMIKALRDYFPYKVIKVNGCEADDIIGTIARRSKGPTVIVSGDKDFGQLLSPTVKQFHPIQKKFYEIADPKLYLKELIIRGDEGDGVPNILSDDDVFAVKGKKQASMFTRNVEVWVNKDPKMFCENAKVLKNYYRNETLIDLTKTPLCLQEEIMAAANAPANGNQQTITQYLMTNRMRNLLDVAQEF
jgi:5'-3' exonuclease